MTPNTGPAEGLRWFEIQDNGQRNGIELADNHVVGHGTAERDSRGGWLGLGGSEARHRHCGHVCLKLVGDGSELGSGASAVTAAGAVVVTESLTAAQLFGQLERLGFAADKPGMVFEAGGGRRMGSGAGTDSTAGQRPGPPTLDPAWIDAPQGHAAHNMAR